MTTLQLIHYIASHPNYKLIVLIDSEDLTPMQPIERLAAVERLSADPTNFDWRINGSLEKGILLCYCNNQSLW